MQEAIEQESTITVTSVLKYICLLFLAVQFIFASIQMYRLMYPSIILEHLPNQYINTLKHEQTFNLTLCLLNKDNDILWEEKDLVYSFTEPLSKVVEIELDEDVRKNKSNLYLMAEIDATNYYKNQRRPIYRRGIYNFDLEHLTFQTMIMPLITYNKNREVTERNLLEGNDEPPKELTNDTALYPHFKSLMYVTLIHDTRGYRRNELEAMQLTDYALNDREYYYSPLFYLNDFWTMRRHLIRINDTLTKVNLTLIFNVNPIGKHIFLKSFKKDLFGIYTPDLMEEVKGILGDTNVYLLAITSIVYVIHIILDMLSFKNDIQFWKNNTSFEGISVKSIFVRMLFTMITFLYILDNEKDTSKYIIFSLGISILINVWKLTRVCSLKFKSAFPFVSIVYQEAYTKSKTDDYDTTAIKLMSLLLLPCFFGYTVYSFIYKTHKGYYSFIIGTLAGGVYIFGFILMTPQLYINYKLKSVEHLPWRGLFYRFINTIIDDLFSFVIKMPIMHRIACFRDDVIFVIYMYQRYIYRVDPNRDKYNDKVKTE